MAGSFKRQSQLQFLNAGKTDVSGKGKFSDLYEAVPEQTGHLLSPNPCVRAFGPAPDDPKEYVDRYGNQKTETVQHYCDQCKHLKRDVATQDVLVGKRGNMRVSLHVCPFRAETALPRIDHKLEWPACARFEAVKEKR